VRSEERREPVSFEPGFTGRRGTSNASFLGGGLEEASTSENLENLPPEVKEKETNNGEKGGYISTKAGLRKRGKKSTRKAIKKETQSKEAGGGKGPRG